MQLPNKNWKSPESTKTLTVPEVPVNVYVSDIPSWAYALVFIVFLLVGGFYLSKRCSP
jgi:hypothetical protein